MTESAPDKPSITLDKLLAASRKKARVELGDGSALYVRHLSVSDLETAGKLPDKDAGLMALATAVTGTDDPDDLNPIPPESLASLSDEDLRALSRVITRGFEQAELPSGPVLEALGAAVRTYRVNLAKSKAESWERMRAAFGGGIVGELSKQIDRVKDTQAMLDALVPSSRRIPSEVMFPPEHKTPMGRAAIAAEITAGHVAQVADLTAKMVSDLSTLTQSVVTDALPAWAEQQAAAQAASNRSFRQAVLALVASIVATIAVAWWQVAITKSLAAETEAQQALEDKRQTARHAATLKAMQDQVTAQRELIEQQRRDSEAIRSTLAALKSPPPALPQPAKK